MSERKQSFPPIIEVQEGREAILADVDESRSERDLDTEGNLVEVEARDFWRRKLVGELATTLLTQKGELLGIVTRIDPDTGEKTPVKLIDLSNEDFGTEVGLNPSNYYARSAKMGLPEGPQALQEVFAVREEAKAEEHHQPAKSPVNDPGAEYRVVRAKRRRERARDDEDFTDDTYLIGGYDQK